MPRVEKYVLEGRVVTMGTPEVIESGAVYIAGNRIRAVKSRNRNAPDGFADAVRISTGGTIYPGLIELHNHLCYNALPLWQVPDKAFSNNQSWNDGPDYRANVSGPARLLGSHVDYAKYLIRYVECRCLLGGVTTSQGVTLMNLVSGGKAFFAGLIRNVEKPHEPELTAAKARIASVEPGEAGAFFEDYLKQDNATALLHLSEGVDDRARSWFDNLRMSARKWAITERLCGVHALALDEERIRRLAKNKGSMVWSPLSNLMLYGRTADMATFRREGVLIGLGSDWAPTGSKNLLGELKVAWAINSAEDHGFSYEDLVAMATRNAARILGWSDHLGSLAEGKIADLLVLEGQSGDPYRQLVCALELDIRLVTIGGAARLGVPEWVDALAHKTETVTVGSQTLALNLEDEHAAAELRGVTLRAAAARLRDGLRRLPELALDVGEGIYSGVAMGRSSAFRVVPDFEEEEPDEFALGSLEDVVKPLELEGITVVDDPGFVGRLLKNPHLPDAFCRELLKLYPDELTVQGDAEGVSVRFDPGRVAQPSRSLVAFLQTPAHLSGPSEYLRIVDQALLLLEQNYVHLSLKRAMHAVDPLQRLRLLRSRLAERVKAGDEAADLTVLTELEFHGEMIGVFNSLRDLHTRYSLPAPFRGVLAYLPFFVERCYDQGRSRYVVTKLIGPVRPASFVVGSEILFWNGTPIERAVRQNGERHAGSNPAARAARGLDALTFRPLESTLPPEEAWVSVRYRTPAGRVAECRHNWLVYEPGDALDPRDHLLDPALGVDYPGETVRRFKFGFFARHEVAELESRSRRSAVRELAKSSEGAGVLETSVPWMLKAMPVPTAAGELAYVRLYTFDTAGVSPDEFVQEVARILGQLPQSGLILDVRGNPGGSILAAEGILQLFTPASIEPERAQFSNSPLNLQLCQNYVNPDPERFSGLDLSPWVPSMLLAVETGSVHSSSFPISDLVFCNRFGQRYYGPVVLVTDALCYSATDIFAAGFRDHGIGPILGTDANTGAGGANVWTHTLLARLAVQDGGPPSPYAPLPLGAGFRVAMRRMLRVGKEAGSILEDLGVEPDAIYRMSRHDILAGNVGLIEAAAALLAQRPRYLLHVRRGGALAFVITTQNLSRVDVRVGGRPWGSFDVQDGNNSVDLSKGVSPGDTLAVLDFDGFSGIERVARYRYDGVAEEA